MDGRGYIQTAVILPHHYVVVGQIILSKTDEICGLATPNQISIISMHLPSLVKTDRYLLKLSTENNNTNVWWADICQKLKFAHQQSQTRSS